MLRYRILPVFVLLAAAVLACNLPLGKSGPNQEATITSAIKTVHVQLTGTSMALTVSAPTPTRTPSPTWTPRGFTGQPTSPAATLSGSCNRGQFITDVTIPDDTPVPAGSSFTKTWRLRNSGTCTWSTDYSIYFDHGAAMGAPASVPLPSPVGPGETVDVSVTLTAPLTTGRQAGYWKMRNPAGIPFGLGAGGQDSFYVQILVTGSGDGQPPVDTPIPPAKTPLPTAVRTSVPPLPNVVYDFTNNYCSAQWQNSTALLPCPGASGDTAGYVIKVDQPTLQDGRPKDRPGLLTHPQLVPGGSVAGIYPEIEVQPGYRFQATLGCANNAQVCSVRFQFNYRTGGGAVQNLGQWDMIYEENPRDVSVDLSSLVGKRVQFLLVVQAMGSPNQDEAFWWQPRIAK